jgi:hypothetical protein
MAPKLCAALLLLASLSTPAWGQRLACFPSDILDRLMAEQGEAASVEGTDGGQSVIRIYANVQTGMWHMFVIAKTSHEACLIASGDKYTRYPANMGRGA